MEDEDRRVVMGLAGVPYSLVGDFSEDWPTPNFVELRNQGNFRKMDSPIPAVPSGAGGTVIRRSSRRRAGSLRAYGCDHGTYMLSFSNFSSFKKLTFWQKMECCFEELIK
ncbi:hypothetical protein AKJ57_01265 [candidate division MSBL1 archaeon SCGC-AAA259A05]|uniref:Uncharacterized protein n=1 Tax=candidate division MSBL1 archaeon SCGC-AAA259A05 TaxID=1698259 RepID=A0A133UB61_9EURY|nr:hypothetical protein AKJ57_01265 [candidate division MSBL1 archaeon SCGC-AAA259A05]